MVPFKLETQIFCFCYSLGYWEAHMLYLTLCRNAVCKSPFFGLLRGLSHNARSDAIDYAKNVLFLKHEQPIPHSWRVANYRRLERTISGRVVDYDDMYRLFDCVKGRVSPTLSQIVRNITTAGEEMSPEKYDVSRKQLTQILRNKIAYPVEHGLKNIPFIYLIDKN